MDIYLIRHGMTNGNKERRYIGCYTDESLCEEGIEQLHNRAYPKVDKVFVSPLVRCVETANIIFDGMDVEACDELREMNFGLFEGKNYEELKDNQDYQAWIDSGGNSAFPNGESKKEFCDRCIRGFEKCISLQKESDSIAFVVHGGTIMAIMEKYGEPKGEYYRWQIENGEYIHIKL